MAHDSAPIVSCVVGSGSTPWSQGGLVVTFSVEREVDGAGGEVVGSAVVEGVQLG